MINLTLFERETKLQGFQQQIGDISENSAVRHLIHKFGLKDEDSLKTKEAAENKIKESKEIYPDKEDGEDRDAHGEHIADAVTNHLSNLYPGHKVKKIHLSNKANFSEITNGLHNDDKNTNPSDAVVEMEHPETKEKVFHGISMKSTEKKGGSIGFKNPTPRHMDKEFFEPHGVQTISSMHQDALKKLKEEHPEFAKAKNKAQKKAYMEQNPEFAKKAGERGVETYRNIAAHISNHLTNNILNRNGQHNQEGHDQLKHFIKNRWFNTASSMPYTKITASGSAKKGYGEAKVEDVHDSHVVRLLNHPKSKMRVRNSGVNVHYDIHDPDTNQWHGLAAEQVKASSHFAYTGPRHNIHPPRKNIEQD